MIDDLERARDSFMARAWSDAHRSLAVADEASALGAEDLERLATAAYMLGRDDEYHAALERAHQAYIDAGDLARAVRCAFWLSLTLMLRGEAGRATGWLGRAQRLLERAGADGVEQGYLLVPVVAQHEGAGEYEAAHAAATAAAEIAERFGDPDLLAIAMHSQGNALVAQGQVGEGLALLDETMVAVVGGELSPIVAGLMYCSVIDGCRRAYALRRAQEWTAALTQWCDGSPTWSPSPAAAWSTAPRSCSSTARGATPCGRHGGRAGARTRR